MDDLRELLMAVVETEYPRPDGPDRVRKDVRRRRVRHRLTAGILGVTLGGAALWVAVEGLGDSRPVPRPVNVGPAGPLDVSTLARAWSAEVPGGTSVTEVVSDEERIYAPTTDGVTAYPKQCSDPCIPLWELDLVEKPTTGFTDIAVGDGVMAATLDGRLAVAASDCRSDGGPCEPLWVVDPPSGSNGYRWPEIAGGVLKVTLSYGELPDHHVSAVAFSLRCRDDGGACDPLWTGDLGVGTAYNPAGAANGVFYQQVGTGMLGFAAGCRSDGGACLPDFLIEAAGDPETQESALYGPVLGHNELIVVAGTGSVYSYPEHCGAACRLLWVGPVSDYLETYPIVAGDLVVVTDGRGVTAFPLGCLSDGETCTPEWNARLEDYTSVGFANERFVVTVDRFRGAGLFVIPTDCANACRPRWSLEGFGEIYGVASDGQTLFVGLRGEIVGYPLGCIDPCEPVWRGELPGQTWWIVIDDSRLIAASRLDDFGSGLSLTVFETPSASG